MNASVLGAYVGWLVAVALGHGVLAVALGRRRQLGAAALLLAMVLGAMPFWPPAVLVLTVGMAAMGVRLWLDRGAPASTDPPLPALAGRLAMLTCPVAMAVPALHHVGFLPAHPLWWSLALPCGVLASLALSAGMAPLLRPERRPGFAGRGSAVCPVRQPCVLQTESLEKSRLLAAVSHDLHQPLYALTLAVDHLVKQPVEGAQTVVRQMKSALVSAHNLLAMLSSMSRPEASAQAVDLSEFSIQPLLERIDDVYGPQAAFSGLRWGVTPCMACVRSHPVLLERMLGNLAANALRYTRQGGVLVTSRLRPGHLLVQVWDTGPGIDPGHCEQVFGEYVRGTGEHRGDDGLGLGLFIVRQCAQRLNIAVHLRSVPGRGSVFSLCVPLAHSPVIPVRSPALATTRVQPRQTEASV